MSDYKCRFCYKDLTKECFTDIDLFKVKNICCYFPVCLQCYNYFVNGKFTEDFKDFQVVETFHHPYSCDYNDNTASLYYDIDIRNMYDKKCHNSEIKLEPFYGKWYIDVLQNTDYYGHINSGSYFDVVGCPKCEGLMHYCNTFKPYNIQGQDLGFCNICDTELFYVITHGEKRWYCPECSKYDFRM